MPKNNTHCRREFIKYAGATSATGLIAGCTGGNGDGGGGSGSNKPLKFGMVPAESTDSPQVHLVTKYMSEQFDAKGSIQFMENNSLIIQSLSAGQIDVGEGGIGGSATLIDSGKDIEMFFTHQTATDYVLVGTDQVSSLEQAANAKIGIGSTTGLETLQTAGILTQKGIIDGIDDLSLQQIGFSSARLQAMLKDNPPIQVTALHYNQWLQLREAKPNFNLLSNLGKELDPWVQVAWFGFADVLKQRQDDLASLVAAEIMLHKELYNSFDFYKGIVRQYVPGGGPPTKELKTTYNYLKESHVWPTTLDVWNKDAMNRMLKLMQTIGITENRVKAEKAMNTAIAEAAANKLENA